MYDSYVSLHGNSSIPSQKLAETEKRESNKFYCAPNNISNKKFKFSLKCENICSENFNDDIKSFQFTYWLSQN